MWAIREADIYITQQPSGQRPDYALDCLIRTKDLADPASWRAWSGGTSFDTTFIDPYRSTDSTIYSVVEGEGRTRIGDTIFDWKRRDIFVIPSWHAVSHEAHTEAVLFSFSDRPVQKALGWWREQAPLA